MNAMNTNGYGCASHADERARYIELQLKKRKKVIKRLNRVQDILSRYDKRIALAGDEGLFDHRGGWLAQKHSVSKDYIHGVRYNVRRS